MSVSPVCSCLSCPTHRGSVEGPVCGVYPSSTMTDAQWALLEPLLPPPGNTAGRGGRPEKHPRRRMLDAIFYVVRGGIAWSALPAEFPPAKTVYGLFRRWVRAGAWIQVHDALRDRARIVAGRSPLPTAAVIDSASVRGADTVPAGSCGYDAGKKVNGRKRFIVTDTAGLLITVTVMAASWQDRDGAKTALLGAYQTTPIRHVFADQGFAGRFVDWTATTLKTTVEIVRKPADQRGFAVHPRRWVEKGPWPG